MSFSKDVKNEMCAQGVSKERCVTAELYGMLLFGSVFTRREVRVVTGAEKLPARLASLSARAAGVRGWKKRRNADGKTVLLLEGGQEADRLFDLFGYGENEINLHLNAWLMEEEDAARAFLRGAFLTGGFVSDPEREYFLELTTTRNALSREVFAFIREFDLRPKLTKRLSNNVIYFKDSEVVADFLTLAGAGVSAMKVIDTKIYKEVRNDVNRRVNFETANLMKSVDTANEQAEIIEKLLEKVPFEELPDRLREAAALRLAHRDEPLSALAARLDPPLSKSGLNHRIKKLLEMAEEAGINGG